MNTILTILMITVMTYEMPKLPYTNNALEPVISQQTIDYHYGKHLQTYVNNLNNLVPGTEFEGKDLVTIVATAPDGAIFNNAGQVLNHTLYFLQFAPKPAHSEPTGKLAEAIKRDFGSFENFKKEFNAAAVGLFGSGWAWLSADKNGKPTSPKKPTVAIRYAPVLFRYSDSTCGNMPTILITRTAADHVNELWSIIDWDGQVKD